jgi:hypothetical protein
MKSVVVDIPYSYLALGLAARDRTEKWHKVLDTVPVQVASVDAPDSTCVLHLGPNRIEFPVIDGRVLMPLKTFDTTYSWFEPRDALTPANIQAQVQALAALEHERDVGRWNGAPIDIECGPYDGLVATDGSIRNVKASDREERRALAVATASSDLYVVDGTICVAGREPLFLVRFNAKTGGAMLKPVELSWLKSTIRKQIVDHLQPDAEGDYCTGLQGLEHLPGNDLHWIQRTYPNSFEGAVSATYPSGIAWSSSQGESAIGFALAKLCTSIDRCVVRKVNLSDALIEALYDATRTLLRWTRGDTTDIGPLLDDWRRLRSIIVDGGMEAAGIPARLIQNLTAQIMDFEERAPGIGLVVDPDAEADMASGMNYAL